MMNDSVNENVNAVEKNNGNVPVEHLENKPKSTEKKADKRLEKLSVLKEKQAAAEKKSKDISAQIVRLEREIHAEETAALDKVCKERNITYTDITDFLSSLPEGMNFDELKNIMS